MDDFICACQEGYSGTFCECREGDNSTLTDDQQCVDINTTLSWTLPPDLMIDMEEDYDGVVVAGTHVSVGFEDITEVAGTIVPLEGTTEEEAVMATSSWDRVEPTPTMPGSGSEQTTSATPDYTLEEELAVDVELSTPTLTPSYTDATEAGDTGATPSLGPEEEVDRGGEATTVSSLPTTTSVSEEEEGTSSTQSSIEEGTTSSVRLGEETTRVTTLSSVEGGVTIGPTPAAACRSNVCKNGGTCLTRYTKAISYLSVWVNFCKGSSPVSNEENFGNFPQTKHLPLPYLGTNHQFSQMFACNYILHLCVSETERRWNNLVLIKPNFQHFGLPVSLPASVCRTPLREQNRCVDPR